MVRLYGTFSNYMFTGETRCAGCLCTSSGWFKCIEPPQTFSNHIIAEIARQVEFFHVCSGWLREDILVHSFLVHSTKVNSAHSSILVHSLILVHTINLSALRGCAIESAQSFLVHSNDRSQCTFSTPVR